MYTFSKKRNRVISVITAFLLFLLSALIPSSRVMAADNMNEIMYYNKYDVADEGYYNGYYSLDAVPSLSSTSTRSIIGDDTRVVDFSKSGVVKLMSNSSLVGTGFIVDAHTIATSAHCVYNKSTATSDQCGNRVNKILVFNSNGSTAMTVTNLNEIHVPRKYIITDTSPNPYDYALITVEEDLSAYACFNLGMPMDSLTSKNTTVSVTGFPGYVNGTFVNNSATIHKMYTGTGIVRGLTNYCCYYDVDTYGGNSGGPVYLTTTFNNQVYYTVIAIHGYGGSSYNGVDCNAGIRMTTSLLQFYKNNPNI